MPAILHASREAALLQSEIHNELTRRGTVEADDQTMAEYVTVLCINEKPIDQIGQELADIGGAEFDASFLTWLSDRVTSIKSGNTSFDSPQIADPIVPFIKEEVVVKAEPISTRQPRGDSGSRLLSHALAPIASDQRSGPSGQKRGLSPVAYDVGNKRRSTGLPSGPKAMRDVDEDISMDDDLVDGRRGTRNASGSSLLDRIGEPGLPNGSVVDTTGAARPLRNIRGRGGRAGGMDRGFAPGPHMGRMTPEMQMQARFMAMQQQQMAAMQRGVGFPMGGGMMDPMAMQGMFMQQQEQMRHMQAMMEQMAQAVQNGGAMPQPVRPRPPTAQPAQKLGEHTISARRGVPPTTKGKEATAIPDKPLSPDLCKYGVGCTNIRCLFSHPSPAATESSGIVLKKEACPEGKICKDADCPYSHVSPAQVHGAASGERRVLCKFPVCTNPSCQFRHEDAEGNQIPPPALTRTLNKPKNENGNEVDMDAEHDDWDVQVGEGTSSGLGTTSKPDTEAPMQLDTALGDAKKPTSVKPLNGTIATPCRFGLGCTNKFCKFSHPIDAPCRYGSRCFKEDCPYSHPPGRKVPSVFPLSAHKNKSASFNPAAPSFKPGQHISQRKFVDESQPVTKLVAEGEPQIGVLAETVNGGTTA